MFIYLKIRILDRNCHKEKAISSLASNVYTDGQFEVLSGQFDSFYLTVSLKYYQDRKIIGKKHILFMHSQFEVLLGIGI